MTTAVDIAMRQAAPAGMIRNFPRRLIVWIECRASARARAETYYITTV